MPKAQVRALLGEPSRKTDPLSAGLQFTPKAREVAAWVYPMRPFEDDDTAMILTLVVLFDQDGHLTRAADGYND